MQKAKIIAISTVLSLLLVGCSGPKEGSSEPGFEYNTPDVSFDGSFVLDLDFSGNDSLKKLYDGFEDTPEKHREIIDNLDANKLYANSVDFFHVETNNYDYNQDGKDGDIGNFTFKEGYKITRDNQNYSKSGTLIYQKEEVIEKDGKPTTVTKDITDGTYSLTCDTTAYQINEELSFNDPELDQKNTFMLSESTLRKYMVVAEVEKFKQAYQDFLDHSTAFEHIITQSSKEENALTVYTYCESIHTQDLDGTILKVKQSERYEVTINKDGMLQALNHEWNNMGFDGTNYSKMLESKIISYNFKHI